MKHTQLSLTATVDVFVAGWVSNRFAVFKLDGPSGEVAWPTSVCDFPSGTANALVLTPYGSVVVVGAINGGFAAAEFDAATGVEVSSRMLFPGGGEARAIALDPAGVPVAVGSVLASGFGNSFMAAIKFSAGAVVWSQYLTGTNADASLVALNTDGGEQWRQSLDGTAHLSDAINALALADSAVIAEGFLVNTENHPTGIAVALDLQSGTELRRTSFAGTDDFGQNAVAAVVTHGNKAIVAGIITDADTAQNMFMDEFDFSPYRPLVREDGATGGKLRQGLITQK
jgi:outer membrane protein assembly factor BamB